MMTSALLHKFSIIIVLSLPLVGRVREGVFKARAVLFPSPGPSHKGRGKYYKLISQSTRGIFKYILFIFFLAGINFVYTAWAEEDIAQGVVIRPQIRYESGQLRDPFKSYLIKDENGQGVQAQGEGDSAQPKMNLDALIVQGIIWGGRIPQAIINNKVLLVGDSIEGAEILSIDKGGITLNFSGEILSLSAPGQGIVSKKIE